MCNPLLQIDLITNVFFRINNFYEKQTNLTVTKNYNLIK